MKEQRIEKLYLSLCAMSVFEGLERLPLFGHFFAVVEEGDLAKKLRAYGRFASEIYAGGGDLSACVKKAVFEDENVYVTTVATGGAVSPQLTATLHRELAILADFAALAVADFAAYLDTDIPLSEFETSHPDLVAEYEERVRSIGKYGYGMFATSCMFRLSDHGEHRIEPIISADPVALHSFIGYEQERARVVENTAAFVAGRPAANVLLYGDAGTGKSSTVKAVANHFFSEGVRLVEIRKDQLSLLPLVMGKISRNPLKFIIFIDDLSFNQSDDNFSMLKAALEGSASAKAQNAVIYATSNRRHIVRERFDDREGNEVHRNDSMQESLSLSARFGLSVLFGKPDKALYLQIVHELAVKYGITMEGEELSRLAEAFALSKGHRSPRCAEQFIDSLR